MPIVFGQKDSKHASDKDLLTICIRASIYNQTISKYTVDKHGRIALPERNLKKLNGKYNTVEEYIQSNNYWRKLRDFEEKDYTFKDWIETLVKNWDKVIIILGSSNLPMTPIFNILMSKKLEKAFYYLYNKQANEKELNKKKVVKEDSKKITPTIDSDIDNLLYYHKMYRDMAINDILITFRRDFSPIFIALIERLKNSGLSEAEIITKFIKKVDGRHKNAAEFQNMGSRSI